MTTYVMPDAPAAPAKPAKNEVILIASGDLRLAANQRCWLTQETMERQLTTAFEVEGYTVRRGHPYRPELGHGFIDSQNYGMEVFRGIHPEAPIVVAESVWQFTNHVLPGLSTHRGPILTVGNWNPEWPGLVGLLNLNGSLTKAGAAYSSLWSVDFTDGWFRAGLRQWLRDGAVQHDFSHVHDLDGISLPQAEADLGRALATSLMRDKAIIGVFDEGCMGMYNAIVPDPLLHPTGVFKERLSQSALYAEMLTVADDEAQAVRDWLDAKGMTFNTGPDPATDLTDEQILGQCRMYIAALRMADTAGCAAIGIQYQLGLKDLTPTSDLAEGLLNNVDRPPVTHQETGAVLYEGQALPHFNEVDECAALDALMTNRIWTAMGLDPATTLHDIRWGEHFQGKGQNGNDLDDFVWVFMISGAIPASHIEGGYAGASSDRQPAMFFRFGGGSMKGIGKAGELVWSRIYIQDDALHMDIGRGAGVALPAAEANRRWQLTNPEWPMLNAVLHGVSRDQLMAKHQANHLQVAYAPDGDAANRALAAKLAMAQDLGLTVHLCGSDNGLVG